MNFVGIKYGKKEVKCVYMAADLGNITFSENEEVNLSIYYSSLTGIISIEKEDVEVFNELIRNKR